MDKEIWKSIKGYEGLYEVSSFGRVRSITNMGKRKKKILSLLGKRYPHVCLSKNKDPKNYAVHRLVAQAFIPNPDCKPCIDHIDTNMSNNKVDNLRWCTMKENQANPLTRRHMSQGQKGLIKIHHPCSEKTKRIISLATSTPVACYDKEGNEVRRFLTVTDAAKWAGVTVFALYHNLRGETHLSAGYKWNFLNK